MRAICTLFYLGLAAGFCVAAPDQSSGLVFLDLDGIARHPLDPADKVASVIVFYGQDCPISNSYAPELNRICASHTNFAFYIVHVDPELTPAAAKEHMRKYDLRMIVLLDPLHRLTKVTQATITPEAVVWGKADRVLYRGRIDDLYAALGKRRAAVAEHNLRDALDAIAAGKPVKKRETIAVGCSIQ